LKNIGLFDVCYQPLIANGLTVQMMKALIGANTNSMSVFVEALSLAGLSPAHGMVIYAHLNK
jgi:hypothetical protein